MASYDVIVVGGGIVGSAVAYGFARDGHRVVVFDEGDVTFRASRANFGLVAVQLKGIGNPDYHRWSRHAADRWADLADELRETTGVDVGYGRPGSAIACLSDEEFSIRRGQMEQIRRESGNFGFDYEMLDHKAMADLIPGIGPRVVGGSYTRYDGQCTPLYLLRALHGGIVTRGGRYVANARVERIGVAPHRFTVAAGGETATAPKVVLAAGLSVQTLADQIGLQVPQWPQRGQVIITERARRVLPLHMGTIRQMPEGGFLFGATREDVGYDDRTTSTGLSGLAARAVATLPFLKDVRVVRSWAGLRVMTPDQFPVYEQSARFPGAFVVTCHSGVTLASLHAFEVAPAIMQGAIPTDLECFSSRRFHVQTAA